MTVGEWKDGPLKNSTKRGIPANAAAGRIAHRPDDGHQQERERAEALDQIAPREPALAARRHGTPARREKVAALASVRSMPTMSCASPVANSMNIWRSTGSSPAASSRPV